jgi:eukaryotic-like serine/threonine-protein kinase
MTDLRSRVQEVLAEQFTLQRELGGGGMSRVFVATEHRLGRAVVVKLLSPDLAAAMSAERFEREIRVAASLQQANIVPVLAAGDVDGLPYYTMPFVEGESLRARLGRGALPISEVVSILRDVSRALAYAHERGVVHRDIKPDNVLLSGHTAVVTDFGIAKAISAAAEGPAGANLTQLGTAVGTPSYMAPEQAAGDPSTDGRADIYAFGCMAYELLTGQSPFAELPLHKMLVAHMSEAPRAVTERRPDCPPALASLVMQCLAKDPGQRPANATELLRRLDAVASPSGDGAALPGILLGPSPAFWRVLAIYAVAFSAVAIVARAAIVAIGLPDWVFTGALIVMALGLPVILFTAYTQSIARRAASATPTFTPGGTRSLASVNGTMATLAIKASPHMSWRRTVRGGTIAVGAFVLLVVGFMALRALGIGPAGSLLASGKLAASDRVVVAAFDAPGSDSSLGGTIAEAVRTNLADSRAMHIMSTSAIVATLEQMQRPDTARVDYATAREIAQRSGAKAVVTGSVIPERAGYVVTIRLVAAATGNDLASYSESAKDVGDLIPAVDRVTKKLRGRMGESLKSVRDAPPLEQVTTASIGALRSYAAGLRANDIVGDYPAAVQHFQEAIRQDSSFAMAYVQLAYSYLSIGGPGTQGKAIAALNAGFLRRGRLPDRERYNVEGAYYSTAAPDRRLAIAAFNQAVALDSTNMDAINSLGVALDDSRQYPQAEQAYRAAISLDPGNGTLLANLANLFTETGNHHGFDSVVTVLQTRNIPYPTGPMRYSEFWGRHQYDSVEQVARAGVDTGSPRKAINARGGMADVTTLRGRLHEGARFDAEVADGHIKIIGDTISPYRAAFRRAMATGMLRGDTARGIAELDSALRVSPVAMEPPSRDQGLMDAFAYAQLGAPAKAREVLRTFEGRLDSTAKLREQMSIERVSGMIANAEGKTDSAIDWFRRSDRGPDGLPAGSCLACTSLLLGVAFDRGGHADSARKYLTQYAESFAIPLDPWYLAPTLYRLGELYQNAGDVEHALRYYNRFVDLWKNADPELQPRVVAARKEIATLAKAKG